jgi:hypothetical protein
MKVNILYFIVLGVILRAQETGSDRCKQILNNVLLEYSKLPKGLPHTQLKSFQMTMRTEYKAPNKAKNQESKLELMLGSDLLVAKNAEMLSISDSQFSFVMVRPTRVLIKSKSSFSKKGDSIALGISGKMLEQIVAFECSDIVKAGITYLKISCTPSESLRKEAQIEKIEYVLDQNLKAMISSTIIYTQSSPVERMSILYGPINLVPRPQEYSGKIADIFLNGKGTLKEQYKGFRFLNNIKK